MPATWLNPTARVVVFLLAALSCSRLANAQSLHSYAGGAIEMSSWGTHSWISGPSLSYDNASDDTMVIGLVGEAGWLLFGPNVAIGADIALPF